MPNLSCLTITKFDDNLFTAGTGSIATLVTWLGFANTRVCLTHGASRLLTDTRLTAAVSTELLTSTGVKSTLDARHRLTAARCLATGIAGLRGQRLTIPLGVCEVIVGFDKIKNSEKVFTLINPSTTTNDLLKLNHIVARAHQHNIADVTGIHTSR